MTTVKAGDWVKAMEGDRIGLVRRVAKNGAWADVDWKGWTKRMKPEFLRVQHTIPFAGGTVTDVQREQEADDAARAYAAGEGDAPPRAVCPACAR